MKEAMVVNVLEPGHYLVEQTLDKVRFHQLTAARLHQLVEVAVHVLHSNVKLAADWVKEDIERRNEVAVVGQSAEEDDLAQFETVGEGVE